MKYDILIDGARRNVVFTQNHDEASRITAVIDGRNVEADAVTISPGIFSILLDGRSFDVNVEEIEKGLLVHVAGLVFELEVVDPRSWGSRRGGSMELEGRQQVVAPMPGKIVGVLAASGQKVSAGQGLLVIEAMKMQNEMRSPKSGTVEQLLVTEGQTVSAGQVLAVIA